MKVKQILLLVFIIGAIIYGIEQIIKSDYWWIYLIVFFILILIIITPIFIKKCKRKTSRKKFFVRDGENFMYNNSKIHSVQLDNIEREEKFALYRNEICKCHRFCNSGLMTQFEYNKMVKLYNEYVSLYYDLPQDEKLLRDAYGLIKINRLADSVKELSTKDEERAVLLEQKLDKLDSSKLYEKKKKKLLIELNNSVKQLQENEMLIKIISNFFRQTSLENIEFYAVPKDNNDNLIYTLEDIEYLQNKISHIKYTLISALRQEKNKMKYELSEFDTGQKCEKLLDAFESEDDNLQEVEYLYKSLVNQYILKETDQTAFYFLLSEEQRLYRISEYNRLCEEYNILDSDSQNNIVEKLFTIDVNKNEIIKFVALSDFVKHIDKVYSLCVINSKKIVNQQIDIIKQKMYVNKLLAGQRKINVSLNDIDVMSGYEFENFIAQIFNKLGYETKVTKSSGDQGIDIVASKNDSIIAIQAKCYSGVVGNHAIMEAVGGMKYYHADKCMVITNRTFTKSAIELAKVNKVELWDRQILKEKIAMLN